MHVGRKVVFALAANVAGAVLGYGALLVIGRAFNPSAYGSFVFASGIGALFTLFATLGLGLAQQRLVARGHPIEAVLGAALRIRLLLTAGGLALLVGATWLLAERGTLTDGTTPAVLGGALAIHVVALGRTAFAETWAGQQRIGRVEGGRLVDAVLLLVTLANAGLMVAHLAGRWTPLPQVGAWWADLLGLTRPLQPHEAAMVLVVCTLLAKLVSFLVSAAWAAADGFGIGPWDPAIARKLWKFALPVALTSAIALVVQNTDVVMLGYFWTAHEVGLYGTALKLSVLGSLAATAASSVLFPRFAQLSAAGDRAAEDETFAAAERWILLAVAPVTAGLVALAEPGIHIAVGDAYLGGSDALRLLACAAFAYTMQMALMARFMGHGQTRVLVIAGLVNALANVVLNLLLIPRAGLGLGMVGAAAATLASNLLAYGMLRWRAHREYGVRLVGRSTVPILLAAAGLAAMWRYAYATWPESMDRVWELAFWGLAGALAYAAALLLLGALRRRDLAALRRAAHPVALWREMAGR